MDSQAPIEDFKVEFDSLDQLEPNSIGVDFGTERTKIVYPSVSSSSSSGRALHFVTFESKHTDAISNFLADKLVELEEVPCDRRAPWKVRVTGVNCASGCSKLKQRLAVSFEVVSEQPSDCRGFVFLLRQCAESDIYHPQPSIDPAEFAGMDMGETFKKFSEAQVDLMSSGGSQFPCLLTVFGSTSRVFLIQEDGQWTELHSHLLAGKSFLGVSQLLTGVKDYSRAMTMAAAGRRANIDLQVRDLLAGTPNSPYGRLPPSLPVFPFGKAVDYDVSFEDTRPEDLAHSLVATFVSNLIYTVTQLAGFNSVRCLRFSGGFFNHESPRLELIKTGKLFTAIDSMDVQFVKIGHTAALGAILASSASV